MAQSVMLPSFAGGELSTNLYGRVDLDKYHSGAALLRNFFVDYRGGVANRAGTKFIAACASNDEVRLIPFIVSRTQSYILEFSDLLIRIYRNGSLVTSVVSPYAGSDIFGLKWAQSADVMTLTHPDYQVRNLSRTSLTAFNIAVATFGATIASPSAAPTCTPSVVGTLLYAYCVTAIASTGEESLPCATASVLSKALDPTAATPVTVALEWPAVTNARAYNIYKAGPVQASDAMPTVFGYIGQTKVDSFTDNNIGPDFSQTPPDHRDPFSPGQVTDIAVTSGGSGAASYVAVTISGDGTGAKAYAISKSGVLKGVVVINGGINYTAATASAGTGSLTVTVDTTDHYPSCVAYFQQRRCYAGADVSPELIEMSKTGLYSNFDVSPAVLDSDAITLNIASREVNQIEHMVPMSTGLVVFTRGSAFLLTGGGGSGAVTPTNVAATPQASTGAGPLPPIVINYNILFQQYEGTVIRDMTFQWQTESYFGTDRSMLANHLFFGQTLIDWAFAYEPFHLLHVVRGDGKLLVMTYVPEQEVYGWSTYDTQGEFESVAVIPEGGTSAVYAVVKRHITNEDGDPCWINYLERFADREDCCIYDDWFLDCALSLPLTTLDSALYPSAATGTITLTSYDPCEDPPEAGGPFIGSGFVMEAKENYDAASAAELLAGTQGALFSTDPTNLACSYDFTRRNLMYLGVIVPDGAVVTADHIIWTNTTGHTVYDGGVHVIAAGGTANFNFGNVFSPQICQKNLDTEAVTFTSTYDASKTVPADVGCVYLSVNNPGSGYTHAAVTVTGGGGSGMVVTPILDAGGGGYLVNVAVTNWGTGYTTSPSFTVTGDGSGATISHSAYQTPSDGTYRWVGSNFGYTTFRANGPSLVDPRNGDFWTCSESCEVFAFRRADSFAQTIAPAKRATNTSTVRNPVLHPVGIDTTWCYTITEGDIVGAVYLAIVPVVDQADEITAATKLTYVVWDTSPFSADLGARLTFGTDGDLYIISLGATGASKMHWRITKYAPPVLTAYGSNATGTMTDVTASLWNTSGPNADGANYDETYFTGLTGFTGSTAMALVRLPATDQFAAVLKFPKEASSDPTDYTKTLFSCVYVTTGGSPAYDYHSGFVTGYMDSSWVSAGTIPTTGWAVVDCRETNNFQEQSDYIYTDLDYTKRWFVFQCYPISDAAVDTSNGLMDVLVEYHFVSGSAPAVVSPPGALADPAWSANYPAYATAISQQNLVYNSMLLGSPLLGDGNFSFSEILYPDPGIYDPTTNSFWFSGLTNIAGRASDLSSNAMFYLDSAFTSRATYNESGINGRWGPVTPPLLRLTRVTPNIAVGDIINTACGKIQIATIESSTTITGTVVQPWDNATLADDSSTTVPFPAGTWSLVTPTATFTGLTHLEGKTVYSLADGKVVGPVTVTGGEVALGFEASSAVVGLKYTSQFKSLRLDIGEPTIQGRRKTIPAVTLRVKCSVGFTVGTTDFSIMYQPKTDYPLAVDGPTAYTAYTQGGAAAIPWSGDIRVNVQSGWETDGVMTVEQTLPLPLTILGLIPEVTLGDNQR